MRRNGNPDDATRHQRRLHIAIERRERASGKWGRLVLLSQDIMRASRELAAERNGPPSVGGWVSQVERVYKNDWLSVLVRPIPATGLGVAIEHYAIRTVSADELSWRELQRVKDAVAGPDRMAVQVYPRKPDLIDAADMYHLWVFPEGYRFDFGLAHGQR